MKKIFLISAILCLGIVSVEAQTINISVKQNTGNGKIRVGGTYTNTDRITIDVLNKTDGTKISNEICQWDGRNWWYDKPVEAGKTYKFAVKAIKSSSEKWNELDNVTAKGSAPNPTVTTDKTAYTCGDNVKVTVGNTNNADITVYYWLADTQSNAKNIPSTPPQAHKQSNTSFYISTDESYAGKYMGVYARNNKDVEVSGVKTVQINAKPQAGQVPPAQQPRVTPTSINLYSPSSSQFKVGDPIDIGANITKGSQFMWCNVYIKKGNVTVFEKTEDKGNNNQIWYDRINTSGWSTGTYTVYVVAYNTSHAEVKREQKTFSLIAAPARVVPQITNLTPSTYNATVGDKINFVVDATDAGKVILDVDGYEYATAVKPFRFNNIEMKTSGAHTIKAYACYSNGSKNTASGTYKTINIEVKAPQATPKITNLAPSTYSANVGDNVTFKVDAQNTNKVILNVDGYEYATTRTPFQFANIQMKVAGTHKITAYACYSNNTKNTTAGTYKTIQVQVIAPQSNNSKLSKYPIYDNKVVPKLNPAITTGNTSVNITSNGGVWYVAETIGNSWEHKYYLFLPKELAREIYIKTDGIDVRNMGKDYAITYGKEIAIDIFEQLFKSIPIGIIYALFETTLENLDTNKRAEFKIAVLSKIGFVCIEVISKGTRFSIPTLNYAAMSSPFNSKPYKRGWFFDMSQLTETDINSLLSKGDIPRISSNGLYQYTELATQSQSQAQPQSQSQTYNTLNFVKIGDAALRNINGHNCIGDINAANGFRFTVNSNSARTTTFSIMYRSDRRGGKLNVNGVAQNISFPSTNWNWGTKMFRFNCGRAQIRLSSMVDILRSMHRI